MSDVDVYSLADLSSVSRLVRSLDPILTFLQTHTGFDCVTVAHKQDDEYIVLAARDRSYGLGGGEVLRWSDTLCARMALGLGPRTAPALATEAAYVHAPFVRTAPVGAYAGMPLHGPDGDLIGSLAALHPTELPDSVREHEPLLTAMAKLIAGSLAAHLAVSDRGRLADRALAAASTDALTGLSNRRAWDWMLTAEEERCGRFGRPAAVLSLDLDGLKRVNDEHGHAAGDELLCTAAAVIGNEVRAHDMVARLGGDEFAVLAVECDAPTAHRLAERIATALQRRGLSASIGVAARDDARSLLAAWAEADLAMYRAKRRLGSPAADRS